MGMKNLKKVAAFIAATVLCMSMSMGVLASSPTDPDQIPGISYGMSLDNEDGPSISAVAVSKDLSEEVEAILQDKSQIKDILINAGYEVKDDQDITVIAASDMELIDPRNGEKVEIPEGGTDFEFYLGADLWSGLSNPNLEGIKNNDTLYILHQKADGTWEVLEATAVVETSGDVTTYKVKAHFDSFSPVAIIKVMSNGKITVLDKNGNETGTITTTEANKGDKVKGESVKVVKTTAEKKSPKTGN